MKIKTKKIIKTLIVVAAILYLIALGVMYFGQHGSEYQPKVKTPEEFSSVAKNLGAKIIPYTTHDGLELSNLYYPAEENMPIFLYINGNAGTIEQAYTKFKPFIDKGYGVLIHVFRGFGANPGTPSEEDFFQDALGVYDLIADSSEYQERDIMIYGYSLGTGVAVYLASQRPHSKSLIIEGGFDSATAVAKAWFPYLPVSLLLRDRYDSEIYIQDVKYPKLHLHGNADFKVPYRFGKRLYEGAPEPKQFETFEGGTHGNLQELGSTQVILDFIRK